MFITKAGQNTTHKTCICTHLLRACTFAHCDEELQASNHNASIDLAELGDREAYEPDLAIDQGVVTSQSAMAHGHDEDADPFPSSAQSFRFNVRLSAG